MDDQVQDISLENAKSRVVEVSDDLKLAQLGVDAEDRLVAMYSFQESSVIRSAYPVTAYEAEHKTIVERGNRDVAISRKQTAEQGVKIKVSSDYLTVLMKERQTEVARKSLTLAEQQLKMAQVRNKAGVAPRKDVLDAETQVVKAQLDLNNSTRDYQLALFTLKRDLDLNLNTEINLTTIFEYRPLEINNIEARAMAEAEDSPDYLQADMMLQAYRESKKRASDLSATSSLSYTAADSGYDLYEVKKSKARKDVELEQARESLRLTQLKYKAGMATTLDVNAAANLVNITENQLLLTTYNQQLARMPFDNNFFTAAGGGN